MRDFLLYVAIGFALIAAITILVFVAPNISKAWFVFTGATAFLCLFVSKMYWKHRKSGTLWTLLVLLLIAHVGLYTIIFKQFPQFPTFLFLFTVPLEVMLVATIVKLCLNVMPGKVKL